MRMGAVTRTLLIGTQKVSSNVVLQQASRPNATDISWCWDWAVRRVDSLTVCFPSSEVMVFNCQTNGVDGSTFSGRSLSLSY